MDNKIECQWCKEKVSRIYGKHIQFKHKGKSSADYKKEFPGFSLTSIKDKENTSKNSGKHMKTKKYKEMFSEMFKGEHNPNHKSKTTKKERKSRSPFSKQFYKDRNLTEDDRKKFIKKALKDREFETREDYWIKRGYSKKEAKEKVRIRQTTFSLEICIKKYGEKKGLERWTARQNLWLKNYTHSNYSKISQILFKSIYQIIQNDFNDIKFATIIDNDKNNEERLELNGHLILPDFLIKNNKKIIEFDGIYWHKNNPENKKRELFRDNLILTNNYKLLHIREDDYNKDPNRVIKECVDFIYEKNS